MFTGIITALGKKRSQDGARLWLDVPASFVDGDPLLLGESVAVNGCCLTVVATEPAVGFDLSPETLARTALGDLADGDPVNLERAMRASDRFGGHIVQGHVDATGEVLSVREDADGCWTVRIRVPDAGDRYLIDKGSISVDGISLTVVSPKDGAFDIAVIPHTYSATNVHAWRPGTRVHLEYDVLAKHVEKLLASGVQPIWAEKA